MAGKYPTAGMPQFVRREAMDVGWFHVGAVLNSAAVSVRVQVPAWTHLFRSPGRRSQEWTCQGMGGSASLPSKCQAAVQSGHTVFLPTSSVRGSSLHVRPTLVGVSS